MNKFLLISTFFLTGFSCVKKPPPCTGPVKDCPNVYPAKPSDPALCKSACDHLREIKVKTGEACTQVDGKDKSNPTSCEETCVFLSKEGINLQLECWKTVNKCTEVDTVCAKGK